MGLSHTAAVYPESFLHFLIMKREALGENVYADRMEEKESANRFLCLTKRVFFFFPSESL